MSVLLASSTVQHMAVLGLPSCSHAASLMHLATLAAAAAFVSWIFAKGILNTSTLGGSFGVVGGLAYASW